jgi:hypothetical protein
MKILKIATFLLAVLALTETAVADKLCLQTTVNKKTFKVTTKSVVAANCPKGYTALIDTSRFMNLSACRSVTNTCDHSAGVNTCDANCADGEYVLQDFAAHTSDSCLPTNTGTPSSSRYYSNGISAGVRYFTSATCNYRAIVTAICCPRS